MDRKKNSVTISGQEAQHAAHTGEDAVNDQTMYHRVDAVGRQCPVGQKGQTVNAHRHMTSDRNAPDHVEGQAEHQSHNCDKQRNGKNTVGQHLVDLHTAPVFPGFPSAFTTHSPQTFSMKL